MGVLLACSGYQYKWDKDIPTKAECFCDMASMGGTLRSPEASVNRFHCVRNLGSAAGRAGNFSSVISPAAKPSAPRGIHSSYNLELDEIRRGLAW